jgi:preprotein translocase subunit YajC
MHLEPYFALIQDSATPATTTPSSGGGNLLMQMVPLVLILGIFYFLLIRPERKRQKQREALISAVKKGDRVMTTSGIYATVAALADDSLTLQIAEGVRVRFSRQAIQSVIGDDAPEAKPELKESVGSRG